MNKFPPVWVPRLLHYNRVTFRQFFVNWEYAAFFVIGTSLFISLMDSPNPWVWAFCAILTWIAGVMGVASLVSRVDRALESIGLDFTKGYGRPTWLVSDKFPARQDIIRFRAAGYSVADYERHSDQLAARLCQPIKAIRQPVATLPVIELVLRRSEIPSRLAFCDLPLDTLQTGEFFAGKSDDGLEKLSLAAMLHALIAGQTGSGKTVFIKMLLTTALARTHNVHIALIDMKEGIDFQEFLSLPNFEMATSYESAVALLDAVTTLYKARVAYLKTKKKSHWKELRASELENEPTMTGLPIGPVLIVVDELAELSKKATERAAKSDLQESLASLARLARAAGIHLVVGTQRPDKNVINMQSKDNLPTRICFSVPSVAASTIVVGDMTATTLGKHPGRAVYQQGSTKIIQAPLITNAEIESALQPVQEALKRKQYARRLLAPIQAQAPDPTTRGPAK